MIRIAVLALALGALVVSEASETCNRRRVEREEMKEGLQAMWTIRPVLNCSSQSIDAATMTPEKKTYFFKGEYYWRLIGSQVAPGYPRLITQDWSGLPGYLDAALTWKDGRTFFFKGSLYWSFHDRVMDRGYPRKISDGFCGIPDNLDAAVLWKPNNMAYFFKGSQYWRFDGGESCEPVKKGYPYSISAEWQDIPSNLDAALQWENGHTYFLKGGYYYRYDDDKNDSSAGKPVEIANNWGLSCDELTCRIPPPMTLNSLE